MAALVVAAGMTVGVAGLEQDDPRDGKVFRDCDFCPEMVVVPAGTFRMSPLVWVLDHGEDEDPQHEVMLRSFALAVTEVTFDEWEACVRGGGCSGRRPYDEGWGRGALPVINVTQPAARVYARWLSRETGKSYRLPNDAEWEYAARGGRRSQWQGRSGAFARTAPVGSYVENWFKLHDMLGNVWEWTDSGAVHGGSWSNYPRSLHSASRHRPRRRVSDNSGFRVARTLD